MKPYIFRRNADVCISCFGPCADRAEPVENRMNMKKRASEGTWDGNK